MVNRHDDALIKILKEIDKLQQAFAGGMFVLILALVIIFFRI